MTFHIITIFPNMFDSYLGESILARAIEAKKITIKLYNPRDYTKDKHKKVDGIPYGGGPGMVMAVEPIVLAVQDILKKIPDFEVYVLAPTPSINCAFYKKGDADAKYKLELLKKMVSYLDLSKFLKDNQKRLEKPQKEVVCVI